MLHGCGGSLSPYCPWGGINEFKKIMGDYRKMGKEEVSNEVSVDLAKFILENNYFEFNCGFYKQKLGTAIGTKFAPAFANVFTVCRNWNVECLGNIT